MGQEQYLDKINSMQKSVTEMQHDYWISYTNFDSWQFWLMAFMLIAPLVLLFILLHKRNVFLILFYGLNVHAWFAYIDSFGTRRWYWEYPHSLTPFFPFSLSLDGALIPVAFLLVYQWTYNSSRNFYLYSAGLSAVFAFILKPILVNIHLFKLNDGVNYFHLFLLYCLIFLISKMITNVFVWYKGKAEM